MSKIWRVHSPTTAGSELPVAIFDVSRRLRNLTATLMANIFEVKQRQHGNELYSTNGLK